MAVLASSLTRWFYQGQAAANAQVTVYETGTTTKVTLYSSADLSPGSVISNPVACDSNGEAVFYVAPDQALRLYVTTSGGTLIRDLDPVYPVSSAAAQTTALVNGQCRLVKSGSNIVLQPFDGNRLVINGSVEMVPSAGVSLAPTGFTPGTTYYIYAFMSLGVMYLEADDDVPSTDTTTGVRIKTGDPTRSLVGMARPITGPAWQDTAAQRFVISWFNPREIEGRAAFTANRATSSATYAEVNTEIRNEFLTWGDRAVSIDFGGSVGVSTSQVVNASIGIDSTTVAEDAYSATQAFTNNATIGIAAPLRKTLSEGYHYATLLGSVNGGATATFIGGSAGARTTLTTMIRG